MPSTDEKNLARIRENQRRSRARRKEYLQDLERKFRNCELNGIQASSELQTAARKVADENKRLRQLLRQHGVEETEIEHFMRHSDVPLTTTSSVAALEALIEAKTPCHGERHRHSSSASPTSTLGSSAEKSDICYYSTTPLETKMSDLNVSGFQSTHPVAQVMPTQAYQEAIFPSQLVPPSTANWKDTIDDHLSYPTSSTGASNDFGLHFDFTPDMRYYHQPDIPRQ
ncbi:MAG: hypothetical protein M1834_005684 [Cirrosporium novae-zelandiae]|nr:MAG: hypothetical protein M1834_005684 [Cirrosporium novae-zelandiae]